MNNSKKRNNHRDAEQQRRKHMNTLYATLRSLLPAHKQEVKLALPDMIQEAIDHIQDLQKQITQFSNKKDNIIKTLNEGCRANSVLQISNTDSFRERMMDFPSQINQPEIFPRIYVNHFDSTFVVKTCTKCDQVLLSDILLLVEDEGLEILSASMLASGDKVCHGLYLKASNSSKLGQDVVYQKLRSLITETDCNHGGNLSNMEHTTAT